MRSCDRVNGQQQVMGAGLARQFLRGTLRPPQRGGRSLGFGPSLVPDRTTRGTPCPLGAEDARVGTAFARPRHAVTRS